MSQNHSFKSLNMTKATLQSLIETHAISPKFLDVVSSFYLKVLTIEESLCMPFQSVNSKQCSGMSLLITNRRILLICAEYMYIFKYAEKTGRETDEPWSIRQSAIYHQVRYEDQRSILLLISPYKDTRGERSLSDWIENTARDASRIQCMLQVHDELFNIYIDGWREYMKHYESELEELVRKSRRSHKHG
jgi:hypothetical protein